MAGYEEGFGNQQSPRTIRGDFPSAFKVAQPHLDALKHELRDGRVVLLDLAEVNHHSIVALENLFRVEFEDISLDADLGGFNAEEFQQYWLALGRWSRCVTHHFLNKAVRGVEQADCMPTQCVPKEDFFRGMSQLSGLNAGRTRRSLIA